MNVNKADNPLSGVKCVVTTCEYNATGNRCVAEAIQIEPKQAHGSKETDCATFVLK